MTQMLAPALPHQIPAIVRGTTEPGVIWGMGTGCLSGDTELIINRGGKGFRSSIRDVVEKWNGMKGGHCWDLSIPTYVQREHKGVVRLGKISNAWYSGIKFTYIVTTDTGRQIRATNEHPFQTTEGWKRLDELRSGHYLHVRGEQYSTGRTVKPRYTDIYAVQFHPYARFRSNGSTSVQRHRLVAEATLNGLSYDNFIAMVRQGDIENLNFIDPKQYHVHHLDRNPKNDDPSNLEVLSKTEHHQLHSMEGTDRNVLFKITKEKIICIDDYEEEMTYDIEVEDEPHNFIANGFVVHNTGKTLAACETLRILTKKYKQPALHIAPNSVLDQTWEEYIKWYGEEWTLQHVFTAYTSPVYANISTNIGDRQKLIKVVDKGQILLFPTESFSYKLLVDELAKRIWCGVVVDEISRFRHWNRWVRGLIRIRSPHRIGASGSLVNRSCDDLWFPMKWIDKDWCGISSHNLYKKNYCVLGGYTGTTPVATRPDREDDIKAKFAPYVIEADLSTIRTMPKRMLSVRRVEMPGKAQVAYKELEDTLALWIESETDNEEDFRLQIKTYSARMQRLLEIGAGFSRNTNGDVVQLPCAKTNELVELISGDLSSPTIVWTWWVPEYKFVTEHLTKEGIKWVPLNKRNDFNNGDANVIVGSIAAGGYGLNLQRATRMIYHSLDFDLEHYQQSQERNWRLTTNDQPRVIVHLINTGTYDEYVREALVNKSGEALKFSRSSALKLLRHK